MLDADLVNQTLAAAMRTGADFAEIFAEDRRSTSAILDDGRVEEVVSGRGPGCRHPGGRGRNHRVRPHRGPERGRPGRRGRRGRGRSPAISGRQTRRRGVGAGRAPAAHRAGAPRGGAQVHEGGAAHRGQRRSAVAGSAITQVSARYGDGRRRILVADSDGLFTSDDQVRTLFSVSCVATGDTGMQTGRESAGRTAASSSSTSTTWRRWPAGPPARAITKLTARPAPSGEMPVVVGPGGGGVLFHEACGHGLEADLVAKSASVFGRAHRRAGGRADGDAGGRRHHGGGVGPLRHRRRGQARGSQRPHRRRRADRLHVGPAPGPQGGPSQLRQRAPPELPAPAHGAHDQHLHRQRRRQPDDIVADTPTACTWRSSAAAR